MWPDRRILDLFKIEHPILLGPMASAVDFMLATAVAKGGGLGAIPCAMITREALWRDRLKPYYEELGIDPAAPVPTSNRAPFDAAFCAVVEDLKPEIVS